jgi:Fungal protein kinase
MTRDPEHPTQFIVTVHPHDNEKPRRFRTIQIISSFGAEPLRGRGTRVYEAIEVGDDGKDKGASVVLKDIWIDHDRTREGDILAELYKEADEEDKKLVEKYFLTTVFHGDVLMEPSVRDDTRNLMGGLNTTRDSVFELQKRSSMNTTHKDKVASGSQSLRAMSRLHVQHPNLTYSHKTHYRIVFKEKGDTIDLVPNLSDVMKVLVDIVAGAFPTNY